MRTNRTGRRFCFPVAPEEYKPWRLDTGPSAEQVGWAPAESEAPKARNTPTNPTL